MTLTDLERLRSIRTEIRRYDEMAETLRSRAERLTTRLTGMPSGGDKQGMAEIIDQIVDNERKAAQKAIDLYKQIEEAERWLDNLPDQQRKIMRAYYVDGISTWEKVAIKTNYDYRHCRKIKDAAIAKLEGCPTMPS